MIDEKKLIEEIKNSKTVIKGSEMLEYFLDCIIKEVHSSVTAIIKEQPKVGEWIPVEKGLPTKRDWYLAIFKEVDTGFTGVPYIADYLLGSKTEYTTEDGWIIRNCTDNDLNCADYYKKLKCVAWTSLPKPYRKEEEQ